MDKPPARGACKNHSLILERASAEFAYSLIRLFAGRLFADRGSRVADRRSLIAAAFAVRHSWFFAFWPKRLSDP
jgi:hypothetical protein